MATYGVIGSPTYAVAINDLSLMLNVLPDNSSNLIDAQDVRDIVAGLYENVNLVSASVSSIGSASVTYTNLNLSSVGVGGISFNSSFNGLTVQQIFDNLFYPYTPPTLTFTVSPLFVEYGDSVTTALLTWSITAGQNNVITSTLIKPVNPNESLATPTSFQTLSGISLFPNSLVLNSISTFTFSVNDGSTYFATASVIPSLRRFWGTLSSSSPLVTVTSSTFVYSDVSTLFSDLSSDYIQSREIMTNNDYVFFIWPTQTVNLQSTPPKVFINGLPNNDWIQTRSNVIFTNQFGYTASYDVWRFNYLQGSFTSSYVLTT